MVSKNDDFIRNGAVDDADDIPLRRGDIFLLIIEVQYHVVWRRANIVFDALVAKPVVAIPKLVEFS